MLADPMSLFEPSVHARETDILTFFEVSLDLLVIRDMDGVMLQVSPSCLPTLGYQPEEICGKRLLDLVHPDDQGHTRACMTEVESRTTIKPAYTVLNRYRHAEGHYVHLEWRAHRFGDRIYAIARDVSDKLAAEKALIQAKANAEAANRAKSDFLANMSHEIRTPLNGVLGLIDALSRTELTETQDEMVDLIRTSGETLTRLISDILDMSRVEAGQMNIENKAFDLKACTAGLIGTYRRLANAKGLSFTVHQPDNLEGLFLGDELRLKQVLNNLLSNAVKFTSSGGIKLNFNLSEGLGEPTLLSIKIEDSGIGFDAEVANQLFQRFSQGDASITRRFGGSGLGLSICQSLIQLMGGKISATSIPHKGSCFSVEIPIPRAVPASLPKPPPIRLPERALSILAVDDHPINQKLIQLLLADLPIEISFASNGREAVEAFQTCSYDLILMDMQMPVMDGLRATQAIRAYEASHPFMARTPIIMVTANVLEEHRHKALVAGADLHLAKPITAKDLRQALNQVLSDNEAVDQDLRSYPLKHA